ncbi:Heterokaryon incompatibility protein 6 OR allele [Lachnellula suecica]|uniref:Heterokaryon incompatibility protein 6 OR allele n=1 Tax=Lachnellula suecica TaxID=602035 RepID=A0A8T9CF37_9HELO|nr:Heterokaryon incompatibility protein 6 OR allele [Lachnellula suecica]
MCEAYQYSPLPNTNTIRLIYLECGQSDESLRCQLKTATLGRLPPYEAISYTWDKPIFSHVLFVEGKSLAITESLFGPLQRVRPKSLARTSFKFSVFLWADAVCINQKDVDERSQQVQLMRKIYENATRVVAWLGPSTDDTPRAWALMVKVLALEREEGFISTAPNGKWRLLDCKSPDWEALSSLFKRPYFYTA